MSHCYCIVSFLSIRLGFWRTGTYAEPNTLLARRILNAVPRIHRASERDGAESARGIGETSQRHFPSHPADLSQAMGWTMRRCRRNLDLLVFVIFVNICRVSLKVILVRNSFQQTVDRQAAQVIFGDPCPLGEGALFWFGGGCFGLGIRLVGQ
jgi:hypothetical protein